MYATPGAHYHTSGRMYFATLDGAFIFVALIGAFAVPLEFI